MKTIDAIGKKFNMLTVLSVHHKDESSHVYVNCVCDCGKHKVLRLSHITSGHTISCGCQGKGYASKNEHGLSHKEHRLYSIWNTMRYRCYNKKSEKYKDYGARGIIVCQEWKQDFLSFYNWSMSNGYFQGASIDRINNDGNYEPTNCRWVSPAQQQRNTRRTIYATYQGVTKPLITWCEELNLPYYTIRARIYSLGWSAEKALSLPVKHSVDRV